MLTQYLKREYGAITFSGPFTKLEKLTAGIYNIDIDEFGNPYLTEALIKSDDIIKLKGSPAELIANSVDEFLNKNIKNAFDRYNIIYKRGILMYGPPGTGKTSIIRLLMNAAIKKDMIVLLNAEPWCISTVVENIREIEKQSRAIMIIWEDFENVILHHEKRLLGLLDGVEQLDNVFYIATTNYIERVPPRISNRPSRFSEVIEIGHPNEELRRAYITEKVHKDDDIDIDKWVEKTEDFTIDHIKDLIISVLALGVPFDDAIEKLKKLNEENFIHYKDTNYSYDDYGTVSPPKLSEIAEAAKTLNSGRVR